MATKADFTDEEWESMHRGLTGAGMLVSTSDPGFTDSFGEASALAKHLRSEGESNTSPLAREVAQVHGTGFGVTSSREKVTAETTARCARRSLHLPRRLRRTWTPTGSSSSAPRRRLPRPRAG